MTPQVHALQLALPPRVSAINRSLASSTPNSSWLETFAMNGIRISRPSLRRTMTVAHEARSTHTYGYT